MRRRFSFALIVSIAVGAMLAAAAQTSAGRVHGVVRREAGGVLAGVEVRLARGPQIIQRTVTDANGEFDFPVVSPGSYAIAAVLTGFEASTLTVEVQSGSTRTIALTLKAATVAPVAAPSPLPNAREGLSGSVVGGAIGGVVGGLEAAPPPPQAQSAAPVRLGPAFVTEAYDRIDDNRWTSPGHKPLSTFSIDVDTASYSNVRRFLNQGRLPPKDAVRIEELIN